MLSGNIINLMLMKSYAARDYSVILVDIMRNSEIGFFFFSGSQDFSRMFQGAEVEAGIHSFVQIMLDNEMTIYLRLPTDINMAGSIFNACFDDCLSIESVGSNTVQHNSRNFGHFIQGVLVINIGNNDSNIINRYTFEKPRI